VRDYVGHGIGRQFHEPPQVAHFRKRDRGADPRFETGWVFTIEPMINAGDWRVEVMSDGWTVRTRDRKLSAQFEHTLLVTETGVEILTDRGGQVLRNSEDVVDR
jgi:methionyl aminopeptidase